MLSNRSLATVGIVVIVSAAAFGAAGVSGKGKAVYTKLVTNMMVDDVNSTLDFYQDVLGFDLVVAVPEGTQQIVTERPKDGALGFAIVKCGNVEMMFQSKRSLSKELPEFADAQTGGSLTFYIEVNDVEQLYRTISRKVTVVKGLHEKFYGKREFYIRDCNGYVLAFAADIRD